MDSDAILAPAATLAGSLLAVVLAFLCRRLSDRRSRISVTALLAALTSFGMFWGTGFSTVSLAGDENLALPLAIAAAIISPVAIFLIAFLNARQSQAQQSGRSRTGGRRPASRAPQATGPRVPPDVFISDRRDERTDVLQIAERLRALKLTVWFDADLRSGTSFDSEIDWNIRRAKCVLVCWSPGAATSDWVRGEATIGREREVLAAAMLKPCSLPAPFNLVHAEDLASGVGPENRAWFRLLDRIGALVGRPGLGAYERAVAAQDRGAIAAWMGEHPHDALFDEATALLKSI